MNAVVPFSARMLAFAFAAAAFSAPAFAAYGCTGVQEPIPATIIVAAPEMRTPVFAGDVCRPLNVQAFLEFRRASEAQAASAEATPAGANNAMMAGRFYMTQNGRRMTADDFDAWMKAKGIRVAKGAPAPAVAPAPARAEDAKNR